jgi:hypothetical protein
MEVAVKRARARAGVWINVSTRLFLIVLLAAAGFASARGF